MVDFVMYLGHQIDPDGLHPLSDKVQAVKNAARRNVHELKAHLGLLAYGKFLPDLSTVLAPLYKLPRKDTHWRWTKEEKQAFQASKDLLTSSHLLVHFDSQLKLILACDASSYGVGAAKCLMVQNSQLGMHRVCCLRVRRTTPNLKRRACVFGIR